MRASGASSTTRLSVENLALEERMRLDAEALCCDVSNVYGDTDSIFVRWNAPATSEDLSSVRYEAAETGVTDRCAYPSVAE